MAYYTNDGTYLKYETWAGVPYKLPPGDVASKLYFPDGRTASYYVSNFMREHDANGNYITFETVCGTPAECVASGYTATYVEKISNETGQAIIIKHGASESGSWRRSEVIIPGPNGDTGFYIDWTANRHLYSVSYETGVVPQLLYYYQPETQYRTLNVLGMGIRYIHLPTAAPSPLGTAPTAGNGYVFDYGLDSNGSSTYGSSSGISCVGSPTPDDGLGSLIYMKTPSGSVYEYGWVRFGWESDSVYSQAAALAHGSYVCRKRIKDTYTNQMLEWNFLTHSYQSAITNPDGGKTTYYYTNKESMVWDGGLANRIEEHNASGDLLRARVQIWGRNQTPGMMTGTSTSRPQTPGNPYVSLESIVVYGANGTTKSAVTTYNSDANGRPVVKTEYDWVSGTVTSTPNSQYKKRETRYDYYVPVVPGNNVNAWWNEHNTTLSGITLRGMRRLNAVRRVTVYDGLNNPKAATEYVYDNAYTKGNVTYERRWDSAKTTSLPTTLDGLTSANSQEFRYVYDNYGNLTTSVQNSG